jgi:sortase A
MPRLQNLERVLIGSGLAFLLVFVLLRSYNLIGSTIGLFSFEAKYGTSAKQVKVSTPARFGQSGNLDFRLWSEKRIKAFQESFAGQFQAPVALLKISRIHLEVPVFNGTDEAVLNRGVGRIIGTAQVGQQGGNMGIAGHRDGFFRALKDLTRGDEIEVITPGGQSRYQVDNIIIVTPGNVGILNERGVPTITLVTCYPFYFVGDAPQRYILQCGLKGNNSFAAGSQSKTGNATQ